MKGVAALGDTGGMGRTDQEVRILKASREFEAQMVKELLRPLTAYTVPGTGDEEQATGSTSVLGDFASEALARAMSDRGGFGIAARIAHELSRSQSQHEPVRGNATVPARTRNPF